MINTLYKKFQPWSKTGSIYIISDTHFDDLEQNKLTRGWPVAEDLLANIKRYAGKNDTLIHLGDVGNPEYLGKLKCYKVLITGNHDKGAANYEPYFDEIYNGPVFISDKIVLSHEPLPIPYALNIHGHSHNGDHEEVMYVNSKECKALNLASDVIGYEPLNLKDIINSGILRGINSIHASCVADARKRKAKRERAKKYKEQHAKN